MSFSRFLSFKVTNRNGTPGGNSTDDTEPTSGLEEPISPADFKNEKRDSDVQSITDSTHEELTTIADPSLNPGALTFEEGKSICSRTVRMMPTSPSNRC